MPHRRSDSSDSNSSSAETDDSDCDQEKPTANRKKRENKLFYPEFPADSKNPEEWRYSPRVPCYSPFVPNRPPGNTPGIPTEPGLIFLEMLGESLDIMIQETNRYARQRKARKWKDLTRAELVNYLAITLGMGMVPKNNYTSYWNDTGIAATPAFRTVMSLSRFREISRHLHFEDEELAVRMGWDIRGSKTRDSIYKIRKFWNAAFVGFRKMRTPDRQLAVDEQMIPFKGQFHYKMKMDRKPKKYGLKVYGGAEAKTGYVFEGHIHTGEKFEHHEQGRTTSRVMNILERGEVLDQGYELYTDNYYTRMQLVVLLLERKTFFCGTLAAGRSTNVPEIVANRHSPYGKQMVRGQAMFLHTETISVCNWKDNANVVFLYSLPDIVEQWTNAERFIRKGKREKTSANEGMSHFDKVSLPQPAVASVYNSRMGGIDLADQFLANVVRYFRVKKWYRAVYNYILLTACCNTRIILNDMNPKKKVTVRISREWIVNDLLQIGSSEMNKINLGLLSPFRNVKRLDLDLPHWPFKGKRYFCKAHPFPKSTDIRCRGCRIPLCMECFEVYHTQLDYQNCLKEKVAPKKKKTKT